MSTRGIYGFRKNGADKLTYCHSDSYPSSLGVDIIEFIKTTSIEELIAIYDRLELINTRIPPTPEQIENCKQWTDLYVGGQNTSDWYCLLRRAQGNFSAYKDGLRYISGDNDFIKYSLFCEHGYIVNLDNNTLEYWAGFQEEPQEGNRYGTDFYLAANKTKYYPCKLIMTFPLDNIPDNAVDQMEKINEEEEKE